MAGHPGLKHESYKITGDPKKPDGASQKASQPFKKSLRRPELLREDDLRQSQLPGGRLEGRRLREASHHHRRALQQ